ncbi:LuxR C-terminal-related transcriptional regulator [Ideonella sp.]|uniref:helix-turn-helix transcriptional regulator n=1 Tax=Ideonella sp. TaxID=1929293 RepID=UPI0035B29FED
MKLQRYLDIGQSADSAAFKRQLVGFAHEMDFPLVSASLVLERPGNDPQFSYIGNRPSNFKASSDPSLAMQDPVLNRLRRHGLPFMYDQKFYVDAGAPELWEWAAPYGFRTGVCVAVRLSRRQQFIVGLDREQPLPRSEAKLTRLLANLTLLAVHCQEAALRFLAEPRRSADAVLGPLSAREIDVLRWTREGKTAWETAQLLCISEPTVKYHLKNAATKLDATSKHAAVLKAISLGLLEP